MLICLREPQRRERRVPGTGLSWEGRNPLKMLTLKWGQNLTDFVERKRDIVTMKWRSLIWKMISALTTSLPGVSLLTPTLLWWANFYMFHCIVKYNTYTSRDPNSSEVLQWYLCLLREICCHALMSAFVTNKLWLKLCSRMYFTAEATELMIFLIPLGFLRTQ